VLRAIAAERTWICNAGEDAVLEERSVRALDLRSILSVPVALLPPARAALVLDSRRPLERPSNELQLTLESFATLVALAVRAARPGGGLPAPPDRPDVHHRSRAYRSMLAWVRRIAASELPVLVSGESGSGKEAVSQMVHAQSRRRLGPFLALNCAALTETLLEAELFGARRGAYTGAVRDRPGLFVQASGGTLFLDEIRPSCCGRWSTARYARSAATRRSSPTCAWSRRRTAIWPRKSPAAGSAPICTTASRSCGFTFLPCASDWRTFRR
jgi:hypothetical protein